MNGNQRKIGIVIQYGQMALSIFIQLVYTPIMLRLLGTTEYGLYNLASSAISYLALLSLGFGASYIRWYNIYKKDDDNKNINKLNGLYLIVFIVIGFVALIAGLCLSLNVQLFFNKSYTASEVYTARILMIFLTINLSISFPSSVFVSYITSQERFIFQKIVNMGGTIVSPVVSMIFLYLGFGSIGMVIATTSISISVFFINVLYCLKRLNMKIDFSNPNWLLLKDIFVFSFFIAINQVIDQINWQTDKIVLGKVVNGTAVAVYAIGAQINTMFINFSTAVSGVFVPKVNKIVSRNDNKMDEELTMLFTKVGRVQWYILSLILTGFIFFGKFFIIKWAGKDYENSYYVALLLMVPAIIPLIQNIGIEIQRAKYKHKFRSIVYLIMSIINVVISIWLSSIWHEIGAAIGTTMSLLLANGLIMNIYYHKQCGIDIGYFWKSIANTLPGYIFPIATGILIMNYSFKSIIDFCFLIFIYTSVFCLSMYFFGINQEEKGLIDTPLRKVLGK